MGHGARGTKPHCVGPRFGVFWGSEHLQACYPIELMRKRLRTVQNSDTLSATAPLRPNPRPHSLFFFFLGGGEVSQKKKKRPDPLGGRFFDVEINAYFKFPL